MTLELENGRQELDLVARLIAMGAVPPQNLNALTGDDVENIISGLPVVYRSSIIGRDKNDHLCVDSFYDFTEKGLADQTRSFMSDHVYSGMPQFRAGMDLSRDAMWNLLNADPGKIKTESLVEGFANWNIHLDPAKIAYGFNNDFDTNIQRAEAAYRDAMTELTARLVLAGITEPVDFYNFEIAHGEELMKSLPPVAISDLIFRDDDGTLRHKDFISVVDYSKSTHLLGENQAGFDAEWQYYHGRYTVDADFEEVERIRAAEEEAAGTGKKYERVSGIGPDGVRRVFVEVRYDRDDLHLQAQESAYFFVHPEDEEKCIRRNTYIASGLSWLKYFRSDLERIDPGGRKNNGMYSLSNLKSGLKNWEVKFTASRLHEAFGEDGDTKIEQAQLLYNKRIISALVNAGIMEALPLSEWRDLTKEKSEILLAQVPLLDTQGDVSEWLSILQLPCTPENLTALEDRFITAGIDFDVEKLLTVLPQPNQERNIEQMAQKFELNIDDYQKIAGQLIDSGRLEMTYAQMRSLDQNELVDFVRMVDNPATPKQKVALDIMASENRVRYTPDAISEMSSLEAREIFKFVPPPAINRESGGPPAAADTRKQLRSMIDRDMLPRMTSDRWSSLTETDGRKMIAAALERNPATDRQKDAIREMLKTGNFIQEEFGREVGTPTFGERNIEALSMGQATRIIGTAPATEEQLKRLDELVRDKLIEPVDMDSMTKGRASAILGEAYSQEINLDGPATGKQKDKIRELSDSGVIEKITPDGIEALTREQAGEILGNAPATQNQMRTINGMVADDKLDALSGYERKSMTFNEANKLIDIGKGKIPRSEQTHKIEPDSPATDNQKAKIIELYKDEADFALPENLTKAAASRMIEAKKDTMQISVNQEKMLRRWLSEGRVNITEAEIAGMTVADFRKLTDVALQKLEQDMAPAPSPPESPATKGRNRKAPAEKAMKAPGGPEL